MSNNEFGLDADYFKKSLGVIARDANRYMPSEMATAMMRLCKVANHSSKIDVEEFKLIKTLQAEIQSLKQELAECQELLKERDGGDHDADCKVYKGRGCNCVHNSVAEYFNPSRHNQR